jgi:hypothetical protein
MYPTDVPANLKDNSLRYALGRNFHSLALSPLLPCLRVRQVPPDNIVYPGKGLFTADCIPAGTELGVYAGVLRHIELADTTPYSFELDDALVVDAFHHGNALRYANDPRDPRYPPGRRVANVETVVDRVEYAHRCYFPIVVFVATCDIPAGAEILLYYGKRYDFHMHPQPWKDECAVVVEDPHPLAIVKKEPGTEEMGTSTSTEGDPASSRKRERDEGPRWAVGMKLEAEMMDPAFPDYADTIHPVEVLEVLNDGKEYRCRLLAFDVSGGLDIWDAYQLHEPREAEPNRTWSRGQNVHIRIRNRRTRRQKLDGHLADDGVWVKARIEQDRDFYMASHRAWGKAGRRRSVVRSADIRSAYTCDDDEMKSF